MKKVTKRGWLGLLALALGISGLTTVKAQDPVWKINAPTSNWFLTDNNTRGLALNPATGHLIVTSRSGGAKGVILDAATGDSVGVLDMTGISGGTFPIQRIAATSDGQLFGANMVLNNGSNFKVYRWADESSAPTVIFDAALTETGRVGDAFGVVGSGNRVTIFAGGSSPTIVKIVWDGTTATKTEYTVPTGIARGGFSSLVSDSTVWVSGTGTSPRLFDFKNGAVIDTLVSADPNVLADADLNSVMTNDYYNGVFIAGPAFTNGKFYVIDATTGKLYAEVAPLGSNANGNNTGGVAIDGANGRVYLMDTNNSIAAFKLADFFETPADLFFSEYIEGSSNNKALEIYNPTDKAVNLANYQIAQSVNGGGWAFFHKFKEVAVIEAGGTYVLITNEVDTTLFKHSNADEVLAFPSVVHFNGDDARALIHITPADTTILDVFGKPDQDPGDAWDVAGVTGATKDKTLIRKPGYKGNPVELASFGTNADDSEWIVKDQNDFSDLGTHTFEAESNEISVTFTLNMATLADTISAADKVLINGAVKGPRNSDTFLGGETLGWDSNATAVMTNVGGDYWKATYRLAKGDTLLYKYRYVLADGSKDQDEGKLMPEAQNPKGWDTRFVIATEDVVLDIDYWNVQETANGIESGIPFITGKQDTVAIFFRVNVGAALQAGEFDPETDSVGVRGTPEIFGNPADWSSTALYLTEEPTRKGDNLFYSGALYVPKSKITVGATYIYKFVTEVGPNNETQWDTDPNREFVGTHADTTIQYQYFQRKKPSAAPLVDALLNFTVDVGILEGLGYFDTGVGDKVQIRGDFNGWSGSDPLTFDPVEFTWSLTGKSLKRAVGDRIQYKFYIDYDASRFDTASVNYLPGIDESFGYEEPGLTGGANRIYVITNVGAPETQGPDPTFFNGVDPRGLIDKPLDVTFSIDMNPAKTHTDPFNPAVDSVYIIFETKYFALVNGIIPGGLQGLSKEQQEKIRMTDPDGDGVYTLTLALNNPSPNHMGFVIAYGSPNSESGRVVTNGGGFDAGRRYYQYIKPQVDENGKIIWPSSYTLPTLTWVEKNLPWEPALDYDALQTSTDENTTVVSEFALYQNYPNPFNPTTTISFSLPATNKVKLTVYNMLGQKVATLLDNQVMPSGNHSVAFDASKLASGTYIYRLEAGNVSATKKMTLIK